MLRHVILYGLFQVYERVQGREITPQDIITEFNDEYPDVRPKDVFGTSKTYDRWRKVGAMPH
jgi:hypothetical protein